jgi:dienelactone hydrolase
MRRPEFIAKQSRCPVGILGSVVAKVMAHETEADNRAALDLLEIRPDDHVLEIGFAHGRTIAAAAASFARMGRRCRDIGADAAHGHPLQ